MHGAKPKSPPPSFSTSKAHSPAWISTVSSTTCRNEEYPKNTWNGWRDRWTTLSFDDYQTELFIVLNSLDQGDPFSTICYLLYNTDLLKIPDIKTGKWILPIVNDAAVITTGKIFSEMHDKLCNIMNCSGGIFKWAKLHNCEFSIEKFQLLDITKKMAPNPINPRKRISTPWSTLILGNQRIPSKETARFLGVMVDNKMNWKAQCTAVLTKGQDWITHFNRIAHTPYRIHAKYCCQLYLSIAVPRMNQNDIHCWHISHPTPESRYQNNR